MSYQKYSPMTGKSAPPTTNERCTIFGKTFNDYNTNKPKRNNEIEENSRSEEPECHTFQLSGLESPSCSQDMVDQTSPAKGFCSLYTVSKSGVSSNGE